jgi:minor extracellular serine protease Vpr
MRVVLASALALALGQGEGRARPHEGVEALPRAVQRYVVQLTRSPLVWYDGEVPGLPALTRDGRGKLVLDSWQAQGYRALLDRDHLAFGAVLSRAFPTAEVHWSYRVIFNGVAVRAPEGALDRLRRLPGVRSVRTTDRRLYRPIMEVSLPLIGAPTYWDATGGIGFAGYGVRVAVIDTGIDPDNPFFDPGSLSYPSGFPKGAAAYTTPKVISARAYFRPDDPVDVERDTPNPIDHLGHGSHVAGTIAGTAGTVFDLGGYEATVSGVAPRARLMNYKVFYRAESGTEGAHEPELMAAFEDAVTDGADVISNSWGGPDIFGDADPSLEAYGAALEAGCVVVFAAGNDGPGEGSMGSPGSFGPFITVGSVSTGRQFTRYMEVTGPSPVDPALSEISMSVGYISPSISSDVGPAPLRSSHLVDGGVNVDGCQPFTPGAFDGAIALVLRGDCSFTEKVTHAADASAIAVIVHNQNPGEGHFRMTGDDVTVPAIMVAYDDGHLLRDWVEAQPTAEAVLRAGYVPYYRPDLIDEVVYSSSRGVTAHAVLKPDLAAPGSLILSANAHRVGSTSTRVWGWKSGTSMATPHVAGAAALLKQAHPEWTHYEVKAALVGRAVREGITSWIDGPGARPWEIGGGRLAVDRLLDIRLLADPAVLSFGEGAPGEQLSITVRLSRVADDVSSFSPQWVADRELSGVVLDPGHASTVALSGDGAQEVAFSVTLPEDADPGEYTGWIDLTDDGSGITTLPYYYRVVPAEVERDLLIVDLQFSAENAREDYRIYYGAAANVLGLTWDQATVTQYSAAPEVAEMLRYRAVLLLTGDDQWNHFGVVGRGTQDRIASYLLRGGRVIIAGQGPLRSTYNSRIQALSGAATHDEYPLYDETTESLVQLSDYSVKAIDYPQLVTADIDLTPGAGVGELSQIAELFPVAGVDSDLVLDPWSTPVLKMYRGNFAGYGYMGMVYDPFPDYGLDRLAEAHSHRAVVFGFGLELINQTPDATQIQPGSREELLSRAFNWVSDRVTLSVHVTRVDRLVTLDASALSSSADMASYWVDFGDGSDPVESEEHVFSHEYVGFGFPEVTLVARSSTGAAGLWRRTLEVQPGSEGVDAGVVDGGVSGDADATLIEEPRKGCGCRSGDATGGGSASLVLMLMLMLALLLFVRLRGRVVVSRTLGMMLVCGVAGVWSVAAVGCKSKEAQKVKEAYTDVIDYSMEYKERHTIWKKRKLPGYVWSVRENRDDTKRPSLDMDVVVPHDLPRGDLQKLLKEAARLAKGATSLSVVRVQAWPQGLSAFGGLLGMAHLAQDGRGWDGKGNTFRGTRVLSGHAKGVWPPSKLDLEVLRALERRRRIVFADPKYAKRKASWLKRPARLEAALVATVAPTLGLTRESVRRTVKNAKSYWWKPHWQPQPTSVSQ